MRHTDNEAFSQGNENSIHFITNPKPLWENRDVRIENEEEQKKIKGIELLLNSSIFIRCSIQAFSFV